MSERQKKSVEWWDKEAEFCATEALMTCPMAMFDTYCMMQEAFARLDGATEAAERIKTAKEFARPTF